MSLPAFATAFDWPAVLIIYILCQTVVLLVALRGTQPKHRAEIIRSAFFPWLRR